MSKALMVVSSYLTQHDVPLKIYSKLKERLVFQGKSTQI